MAMTPLERKRASLERKAAERRRAGDPTDAIAHMPFWTFLNEHQRWRDVADNLQTADAPAPVFENDEDAMWSKDWENHEPYRGSIGRAERMVEVYLDGAATIARIINDYKRAAIDAAIEKIQAADLTDPAAKKQALADIVRLTKMRDQLDKNVRWELPQWKVHNP